MINVTSGSPSSGMSHNACTPPALNGDPSRVGPVGDPGQGACIPGHEGVGLLVWVRFHQRAMCFWLLAGSLDVAKRHRDQACQCFLAYRFEELAGLV